MIANKNEHCEFLQDQINNAVIRYEKSIEALQTASENMFAAKNDVDIWQKALQSFTRDLDSSYQPIPIGEPSLIAEPPYVIYESRKGQSYNVGKNVERNNIIALSPNAVTNITKAGVMRQIMRDDSKEMNIDTIFNSLPESLPMKITKADLWKMIPRFLKRKEIIRTGRGLYKYNPDFLKPDTKNSLFQEDGQENS